MSTEDIKFRLTTDEAGAVAGFKRFRNEVLNNDKALQQVGKQGKLTSMALKDAANVVGPEFAILGDRIDHITGALADVNGASLIAKASLVGLVAVGSFEVGNMLSELILQTEAWKEANAKTVEGIGADFEYLGKIGQDRFEQEVKLAELAVTQEQKNNELTTIRLRKLAELSEAQESLVKRQQELNMAMDNDLLGYGTEDNAIAQEAVAIDERRVKMLKEQLELVTNLRDAKESDLEIEIRLRQEAANAIKAQNEEAQRQAQIQANLQSTQENYLANLDAELVRIRDGEEAYMRLTLAKQGFNEETIESALRVKAEINELSELRKTRDAEAARPSEQGTPASIRVSRPGELRGEQQRFLTRGVGMRGEEKLLAAAKEQAQRSKDLLAEAKKQTALLAKLPKGVTE